MGLLRDLFGFGDLVLIRDAKALSAAGGTFGVTVAFAGEDGQADASDDGSDANQDQAPPAISDSGPIGEPSFFASGDPVVFVDAREMASDNAKDNEKQPHRPNDGSD